MNGVQHCPTDDTDLVALYKEALTAGRISYGGVVSATDPDYDPSYENEGDPVYRWVLNPTQP